MVNSLVCARFPSWVLLGVGLSVTLFCPGFAAVQPASQQPDLDWLKEQVKESRTSQHGVGSSGFVIQEAHRDGVVTLPKTDQHPRPEPGTALPNGSEVQTFNFTHIRLGNDRLIV